MPEYTDSSSGIGVGLSTTIASDGVPKREDGLLEVCLRRRIGGEVCSTDAARGLCIVRFGGGDAKGAIATVIGTTAEK